MTERQKQSEFLKTLLAGDDCAEHRELHDRLVRAEQDERCMKRACLLVVVVTFIALAVVGYLFVLEIPESMSRMAKLASRLAEALALGSAMCFGLFVGLLFWHRALIGRLQADGRRMVTARLLRCAQPTAVPFSNVVVHEGDTAVYQVKTHAATASGAEVISLPKAS